MQEVNLTLTQTFFLAAQEGTYSAAARRLNISYQSVANHIRRLEQRVGEKLVVAKRGAKSISLTPRGTSLYRLLEPEFDAMLARLGSMIDKERPVIRIGMPQAIFFYLLAPVLTAFRQLHPNVEIVGYERDVSLPELIYSGTLDVCLSERYFGNTVMSQRVICHYRPALVCPAGWPLPANEAAVPKWALGRPLITYEPGQMLRNMALEYLSVDNEQPRVVVSTSTSASAKRCVDEGLGFALLPAWCIEETDDRIQCAALTNTPKIPIYFGEATYLRSNPYVQSLYKLCLEVLAKSVEERGNRCKPLKARKPAASRKRAAS
ncbi:LysR family transcriptional regulator [Achromobacter anxifer]|jgi:molybdate transport repressor ModE-like protein|uniref:LysR family transcriptional regulator n=1 Tax=Achromobacter anxifer TaxID=1287737 RepID=UPI0023F63AD5|nr:LysR family transcriptional regulator [Achromobacter anxifer]MDF8360838.1 LysR family transcriptional regulator [Achromobacter anxifer]